VPVDMLDAIMVFDLQEEVEENGVAPVVLQIPRRAVPFLKAILGVVVADSEIHHDESLKVKSH
jgi:hypothetical protein